MAADEVGHAAAFRVTGVLGLAEAAPPPAAKSGLDLPLPLELLVVGVVPAVMAIADQPLFPPPPIEVPTGASTLLDGLDEPVVAGWTIGHVDFCRVSSETEASPFRTGAGDGVEGNDLQRLHGDAG